jgi:transcriptional regulator with XRE-family HTH domain
MKNEENENMLAMRMVYYKKKLGLTNEKLAKMADLPVNTISRISSGATKEPTLKTLKKIAKALDCTIDDLQPGGTIEPYYLDEEAAQLAQEVYENPNLRVLFDASRKLSPDDIKAVIEIVKRMQATKY